MSQLLRKHWPIIIILSVSLVTHFIFFGYPNETVFDEVHFGKFISGYFTHEYYFDIHPPLGKLLISGVGYVTGFKPGFSFAEIGEKFPDSEYLWLRFLPTLAGALLPLIIFLLALQLKFSKQTSFLLGILLALENAFVVQSRFILLDSFLLLFGFSALLLYFLWRNGRSKWFLLSAGVMAGMAVSIKWTGLSFLAIIGILELFHLWKDRRGTAKKRLHSVFLCLIFVPVVIYLGIFVIHLGLLSKSGPGDAFMTPEFRKTLVGSTDYANPTIQPLNLVQKIIELNQEMYISNAGLTATHPYSSKWYTWPFMQRPIYYWHGSVIAGQDSRIYFFGNPLVWFLSTLAIIYLIIDQLSNLITRKGLKFVPLLLIGGYIVNMLPFIGISRAMFLYHYMIGYVFALLALGYLLDSIKNKKAIFALIIAASLVMFIFFAPLTYGHTLTPKAYNLRVWLPSWQ